MECLCKTHPGLWAFMVILFVINFFSIFMYGGAYSHIMKNGYRNSTVGQWVGLLIFLPSVLIYAGIKYGYIFIAKVFSYKIIDDDRIR